MTKEHKMSTQREEMEKLELAEQETTEFYHIERALVRILRKEKQWNK